jgi:hypothetical protein
MSGFVTAQRIGLKPSQDFSPTIQSAVLKFPATQVTFYRLYGVAMLRLLTGYAGGLPLLWQGTFPWAVVNMGIVSNTGATFVLIKGGSLSCKSPFVMIYGAIALSLILSAAFPAFAITPIF